MSKSGISGNRTLCLLTCCVAWLLARPDHVRAECKPDMALSPGDHMYNLDFGGMSRTYVLHVPPGYDGLKPVPLVFDLHGFSSNGPQQLGLSGFADVADDNGFLVVAPTGYMNSWNGDIAFGAAYMAMLDDVGLMKAIVEDIAGKANLNHGKVYSTGLSNGAAMTNTLGCQAADTFAAVAPVADPLDIGLPTCMPVQPTAVIGFHGYDDQYVPYEGGEGSGPRLPAPFPSIPDTLAAWAKIMQCTGTPDVDTIEGRNKCEIYRECGGGVQVGYCSLEGGHVLYQQSHLNIAEYAWKFFDQFSLPLPDADGDGIGDQDDNCVHVANPDQADANANCVGDACECSADPDCDDGMFCNGTEACVDGACAPGTAACPDGQRCDESARQCGAGDAAVQASAGSGAGAPAGAGGQPSAAQMTSAVSGVAGTGAATRGEAGAAGSSSSPTSGVGAEASADDQPAAAAGGAPSQPASEPSSAGCSCHIPAGGTGLRARYHGPAGLGFGLLALGLRARRTRARRASKRVLSMRGSE